jgi:sec-independent protein translocase protein TatB
MFDIGWSEMVVIMLVALVVIGPKDLPRLARTVGQWAAKGRAMAREFQRSLEDMAREAELDDVKREIEKVGRTNIKKSIEKTIDPRGDLSRAFDTSSASKPSAKLSNGEAKEPASSVPEAARAPAAKPVSDATPGLADMTPQAAAASRPGPSTEPKAEAKPKAAVKPKADVKPKAEPKPNPEAKPKAATGSRTRTRSKTTNAANGATAETGEAETIGGPR